MYLFFLYVFFSCIEASYSLPFLLETHRQDQAVEVEAGIFKDGVEVGQVDASIIGEASGLAASIRNHGVLWTHNDFGDEPRIFGINTQGDILGIFTLSQASNVDYEDIAVGPGPIPGVSYIYIGDIGNNQGGRTSVQVYRVAEPIVDPTAPTSKNFTLTGVDKITLTYPSGEVARNAETLLIDPVSANLYVIAKEKENCPIYKTTNAVASFSGDQSSQLLYAGQLNWLLATGGDISLDGTEILLKNQNKIRYYERDVGVPLWVALLNEQNAPLLPYTKEFKGEAIAFAADKSGFYTVSESRGNAQVPLLFYERVDQRMKSQITSLIAGFSSFVPSSSSQTNTTTRAPTTPSTYELGPTSSPTNRPISTLSPSAIPTAISQRTTTPTFILRKSDEPTITSSITYSPTSAYSGNNDPARVTISDTDAAWVDIPMDKKMANFAASSSGVKGRSVYDRKGAIIYFGLGCILSLITF